MKQFFFIVLSLTLVLSCDDTVLPKPNAYLRLEYPTPVYKTLKTPLPFSFEKNSISKSITSVKTLNNSLGIDVNYPSLKGTIYLTYNKIENNNLERLLRDTQNLTQKHTIKADAISSNLFENKDHHVYGMFYEIDGDAASQSQFYVTDSLNHFVSGSLYFYAKPNYDSLFPASEYLKKDIKRFMETLRWSN